MNLKILYSSFGIASLVVAVSYWQSTVDSEARSVDVNSRTALDKHGAQLVDESTSSVIAVRTKRAVPRDARDTANLTTQPRTSYQNEAVADLDLRATESLSADFSQTTDMGPSVDLLAMGEQSNIEFADVVDTGPAVDLTIEGDEQQTADWSSYSDTGGQQDLRASGTWAPDYSSVHDEGPSAELRR